MQAIRQKVAEIEAEMGRIGFWWEAPGPVVADESELYSGLPFERWLQLVFLPKVLAAVETNDFRSALNKNKSAQGALAGLSRCTGWRR